MVGGMEGAGDAAITHRVAFTTTMKFLIIMEFIIYLGLIFPGGERRMERKWRCWEGWDFSGWG